MEQTGLEAALTEDLAKEANDITLVDPDAEFCVILKIAWILERLLANLQHMPNIDTLVVAIFHQNRPILPQGNTVIEVDDEVFFIAARPYQRCHK